MIEGLKVVTADEMRRIEKLAYKEGASEQAFMETAGLAIAESVIDFIELYDLPKTVTLLVGKGNNGGDAFAAGAALLELGYKVMAHLIYSLDDCSPLCTKMCQKFRSKGGAVHQDKIKLEGVILDGLVGTGFRGKVEGVLKRAIEQANHSGLPIIAIDIPSGLNGITGEVSPIAIRATETIFLGLPKIGFFLKEGWDHVGQLRYADFGLGTKSIAKAKPIAYFLNEKIIANLLPVIKRSRHKYEAGYVLAVAGSLGMPGAALLATTAALHTGAGIVRLFHPKGMQAELCHAPFELIREGWDVKEIKRIQNETARAKALLIGPGIGRTKSAEKMVEKIFAKIVLPMVIDADALFFLSKHPAWKVPKGSVLTPHHGEMQQLLAKTKQNSFIESCQAFAESKKTTIVLKGAPTFIFHPGKPPLIITRGDPGMATAGSGDVLTGMIAALMAQGLEPRIAAALAVTLHGMSGEAAAHNLTSYCMTASALIDFLPDAFMEAQIISTL